MRSRANLKSHPIHPMLIPFPIAFFTGTLIFDVLGYVNQNEQHYLVASYLGIAGIIGGLVAAIPGIIDYFYTVPPESSGKKRATRHGLTNITMLILFSIAAYYRRSDEPSELVFIALEAAGFILMCFAGWMGATLVYRNQIGVDPRYANAGKWNEETIQSDEKKIKVAKSNELELNQMKLLRINDKRIVLALSEEGYVAFDDHCTHRGGSLAGGSMICGTVQCPWHGSQFDVKNGEVKSGPAKKKIGTYKIVQDEGVVYISL